MLVKPNWEIFKAKFSENPQDNFEWFCYLLFSKEYNQPYGIHRYKNQSGIETDPIEVGDDVIGWQSKFYEDSLSNHKEDLLGTLTKTKRDNPKITKIILYTNSEWGQGRGTKEPQAKIDTEEKAKELNIDLLWRTRSYFESPFVCQEQKGISRYFFELDTKWKLTDNGFKDTLRYCYLKHFKTISLLDEKKKSVSDIFVNLAISKERKEEKSNDKTLNREDFLSSYEEIHKPKEPIEIKELISISKKSLIYGKAGIGKTTLCKYIAYKWAKGELYNKFEYVVYIPLRKWDSTRLKEVIRSHYYSQYKEEIYLDIKENSNKILLLFDGYDELKSDKRDGLHKAIRDNKLTNYIITTRPYGYQKSDFRVDEYFETIGFTDEDVEKYIDAFFKENNDKAKSLKAYLETNISIRHIAYIPLMLEMICSQWEQKKFNESLTMTELYSQVVEDILNRYSAQKDDIRVYKRKNRKKIKEQLGKLAFRGLTKQTILFDGDFIEDSVDDVFFEENVIYSGFLKSDAKEKDLLDNHFEFLHLTFQEYFSALYVSMLSNKKQKKIIQKWKFYPHMQMFFAFLTGLIENKEFLLEEIESEPKELVVNYIPELKYICALEINHTKLSEFFLEYIESIDRQSFNNENLIRKITFSPKFDTSLFEKVVEKVKDEYILVILAKNNLDISLKLIDLIEKNIYKYERLIPYLANIEVYDEKYIDRVFEFIKNNNLRLVSIDHMENLLRNLYLLDKGSVDFEEKLLDLMSSLCSEYKLALLESFAKVKNIKGLTFLFIKNFLELPSYEYKHYLSVLLNFIKTDGDSKYLIEIVDNNRRLSSHAKLYIYQHLIKIEKQIKYIDEVISLLSDRTLQDVYIPSIINFLLEYKNDISQKLFDFCIDDKIYLNNRIVIANNLFLCKSIDKDKINSSIRDKNLHIKLRKAFLHSFVRLDSINCKEIKDVFYVIQEEDVSYQQYFISEFIYLFQKENSHIGLVKDLLLEKGIDATIKLAILQNIVKYDTYNDLVKELLCSNRMSINMKYELVTEYAHNKSVIKEFFVLLVKILRNKKIERYIRKNVCGYLKKVSKNIDKLSTLLIEEKEELKNNWLNSYEINSQYINNLLNVVDDGIIDNVLIEVRTDSNLKYESIKILDYLVDRYPTKLKEIFNENIDNYEEVKNIQIKLIHKYENPIIKKDKFLYSRVETKLLFKFYDEKEDKFYVEAIKWKLRFSKQIFYIKDNKLYTIENGKEIHTKKPLTKEYIELLTNHKNLL